MTTKVRQPFYQGSAIASLDGRAVTLMVYHLGGLNFDFSCSRRPHHRYTAPTAIDAEMFVREFADVYDLTDIKLEFIRPTGRGR
jgi:hypothetical protein